MSSTQSSFPLSGVIGIVDASDAQVEQAIQLNLSCIEVRADLLISAGLTHDAVFALIAKAKLAGLSCLYTLRHADEGGSFNQTDSERVDRCHQALQAGADIIDLEHGTQSSKAMLAAGATVILSHHNFNRMINAAELSALSDAMESQKPAAVKIIPTGSSLADAATMLTWVRGANVNTRRIGFSMGADGALARILTLANGAPVTYASFGEPVAPGQIDIQLLLSRYRCMSMTSDTKTIAVFGNADQAHSYCVNAMKEHADCVYIEIASTDEAFVEQQQEQLNINAIVRL